MTHQTRAGLFTTKVAILAALLCASASVRADAVAIWHPPQYFERTFGDVRIVVGTPRPPEGLPGWPVLYVGGKRIADYPKLLAQEVYASPDGNHFLLLSNLGLSSYAVAVIDREGQLVLSIPHDSNPFIAGGKFHYCRASVTNTREWVNLQDAAPRFELIQGGSESPSQRRLKAVTVRGCDGKDVVFTANPQDK